MMNNQQSPGLLQILADHWLELPVLEERHPINFKGYENEQKSLLFVMTL